MSTSALLSAEHSAQLMIWRLCNMSLPAFAALRQHFVSAIAAMQASHSQWQALNLHHTHLARFKAYRQDASDCKQWLLHIKHQIQANQYHLVFQDEPHYPKQLDQLATPPPLLFYQGNVQCLSQAQLAIVGTRNPSPHATKVSRDFAHYLAAEGLWITSGLATGIDQHAHLGALAAGGGRTVGVLGTGIDLCYPANNKPLLQQIVSSGGCIITELLPGTPPNKHNCPRRNRLVSGLSLAALVVEAALKSGSLITAQQASEQGKQVFAIPGHIDNPHSKGCHYLIREGATLVDTPQQIIEDLALPRSWHQHAQSPTNTDGHSQAMQHGNATVANSETIDATNVSRPVRQPSEKTVKQSNKSSKGLTNPKNTTSSAREMIVKPQSAPDVPSHLLALYVLLDWVGQDMDTLMVSSQLEIATLTSQLMELELLGFVVQQGGFYLKCRS